MHQLVRLAKDTIEGYIEDGKVPPVGDYIEDSFLTERAGVFVSLKTEGNLRGCIGTFMPSADNIAEEVIHNAISAATRDPRFRPVSPDELSSLTYSVDVLSAPERVDDMSALDHKKYGIIVVSGQKKGLLLPDLEGVDSVEQQIMIARQKAGILPGEDVELFRFEVKRYR